MSTRVLGDGRIEDIVTTRTEELAQRLTRHVRLAYTNVEVNGNENRQTMHGRSMEGRGVGTEEVRDRGGREGAKGAPMGSAG